MREQIKKTHIHQLQRRYPVILHEENEGGYWVSCPAFEGCYSQGRTPEEAIKNIREAISLCREELPIHERFRKPMDVRLNFVRL